MSSDRVANSGFVSVIMPCCGQLEHTKLSVPRLMRYTRNPFEVMFLDAGSLDGTEEYLAGVAAASATSVSILRSAREEEFASLVRRALHQAKGQFIAWVNNDVLVSEWWLDQLVGLATTNDNIGLVGPMSNLAPEDQLLDRIPYHLGQLQPTMNDTNGVQLTQVVDGFAQEYRNQKQGEWVEVERVGGFCWLAKREVLSAVPLLESDDKSGVFNAHSLCARVRGIGYRLGCCRDLYVHNFGSYLLAQ